MSKVTKEEEEEKSKKDIPCLTFVDIDQFDFSSN